MTGLACVAMVLTLSLFALQLWHHTRSFKQPALQKIYLRICLLTPLYAASAWATLEFVHLAGLFEMFRGLYEAYALYAFMSLLITFCGGRERTVAYLDAKQRAKLWLLPYCGPVCSFSRGATAVNFWYFCTIQFMVCKPLIGLTGYFLEQDHNLLQHDGTSSLLRRDKPPTDCCNPHEPTSPLAVILKTATVAGVTLSMLGVFNAYKVRAKFLRA